MSENSDFMLLRAKIRPWFIDISELSISGLKTFMCICNIYILQSLNQTKCLEVLIAQLKGELICKDELIGYQERSIKSMKEELGVINLEDLKDETKVAKFHLTSLSIAIYMNFDLNHTKGTFHCI